MLNIIYKYKIASILFLYILTACFITNNNINESAMVICIYFLFRWITDYRKCTISFMECKLRGVKKEKGYLYQLINPIIDLNKSEYRYYIYVVISIILIINIINKKSYKYINNL